MPNKELIREWVDALRSGDYEQGKGGLKFYRRFNNAKGQFGDWEELDKPRYCCLGVLCEIAEKQGKVTSKPEEKGGQVAFDGAFGLPPVSVEQLVGIDRWAVKWPEGLPVVDRGECPEDCEDCKALNAPPKTIELAALNDNREWNFNQIADVIEKEWLVDA